MEAFSYDAVCWERQFQLVNWQVRKLDRNRLARERRILDEENAEDEDALDGADVQLCPLAEPNDVAMLSSTRKLSCTLKLLPGNSASAMLEPGTFSAVFDGKDLRLFKKGKWLSSGKTYNMLVRIVPIAMIQRIAAVLDNRLVLVLRNCELHFELETDDSSKQLASALAASLRTKTRVEPAIVVKEGCISISKMKQLGFKFILGRQRDRQYYATVSGGVLQLYNTAEENTQGCPVDEVRMEFASVKPCFDDRVKVDLICAIPQRTLRLTFSSAAECAGWQQALRDAIMAAIMQSSDGDGDGWDTLNSIYDNPSNQYCADCGINEPQWASINLGITVCENCAGCHRELGVHYSKVRSIPLDTPSWVSSTIKIMTVIGNENANKFWESNLPCSFDRTALQTDRTDRMRFINDKYVRKCFCVFPTLNRTVDRLNAELLDSIKDNNKSLVDIMKILFSGASVSCVTMAEGRLVTAPELAKMQKRYLIADFLNSNVGVNTELQSEPESSSEYCELENMLPRSEVRFVGIIYKTNRHLEGFKERYAVLERGRLTYYKNNNPKGQLCVTDIVSMERRKSGKFKFCISLFTTADNDRQYLLATDKDQQTTAWYDTIYRSLCPRSVYESLPTESKIQTNRILKAGYVIIIGDNGKLHNVWMSLDSSSRSLTISWHADDVAAKAPDFWPFGNSKAPKGVSAVVSLSQIRECTSNESRRKKSSSRSSMQATPQPISLKSIDYQILQIVSKTENDTRNWMEVISTNIASL